MRLFHGVLGLLMFSGGAAQAGWPCDICMCPKVMLSYDPETDESFWECEEHTCEADCDCGPGPIVYRYYSGEQYEGECSFDCQVYCEQIVVDLNSLQSPTQASAAEAAVDDTAVSTVRESENSNPPKSSPWPPAPAAKRSFRLKEICTPSDHDLNNFEFRYNEEKWNRHVKEANVMRGSDCYLNVECLNGERSTLKLFTVKLKIKDAKTGSYKTKEMRLGYEMKTSKNSPPCSAGAVQQIRKVMASQEGYSTKPTQGVEGFYQVSVGPTNDVYWVRTKRDLKEKI